MESSSAPHIVEDCIGLLQFYSDGTTKRSTLDEANSSIGIAAIDNPSVFTNDYVYDSCRNLSLRLYKPPSVTSSKLPILFYFHGGGFCIGSRLWPLFHNTCLRLATGLGTVVVSVDYRLAPEHRLPAAIDDAVASVEWLRDQATTEDRNEGMIDGESVDLERVFLSGDSAGANIVHQLATRLGFGSPALAPVKVKGYVMFSPFFGGIERTPSEEGPPEPLMNLEGTDRLWRLALPEGENRDHPLSNPFAKSSPSLEPLALAPILVFAGGSEILKDRIVNYVERLKELGKKVDYFEFEGQFHSFVVGDPYSEVSYEVLQVIKRFML